MVSGSIEWSFNRPTYLPGDTAWVNVWFSNAGDTSVYLSELEIEFDFGRYSLESVAGSVPPHNRVPLGRGELLLPNDVVGQRAFRFGYRLHECFDDALVDWVDTGYWESQDEFFLGLYPTPLYRAFISRGLWPEDRALGDPVAEMIREWGFQTTTVGIEVHAPQNGVPTAIREHIGKSDAMIALATPRFQDELTGLWRTLEWLHAEAGIAFGADKPLLILRDNSVSLGGLPSYLSRPADVPVLSFDRSHPEALQAVFSGAMPSFRDWIATKKRDVFLRTLGKIAVGSLAAYGAYKLLRGSSGASPATSQQQPRC